MIRWLFKVVLVPAAILLTLILVGNALISNPSPFVGRTPDYPRSSADGAVERLAEAIKIHTVTGETGASPEALDAFRSFILRSYPLASRLLVDSVRPSILFRWTGGTPSAKPTVLLAHFDVVPADALDWTHPPFAGHVDAGTVWGRGALDNKGGVIAVMDAVESLLLQGFKPKRTLYVALGHDEELDGEGAKGMLGAIMGMDPQGIELTLDEGGFVTVGAMPGVVRPIAMIGIAEKGYVSFEVSVRGASGHASSPIFPTVIGRLATAVTRIEGNQRPMAWNSTVALTFDHIAPYMSFFPRLLFSNRWLLGYPLMWLLADSPAISAMMRSTAAPTMLLAGVKDNVLASSAKVVVNVRLLPGETETELAAWLREVIDDSSLQVTRSRFSAFEASPVTPLDHRAFGVLKSNVVGLGEPGEMAPIVAPYLVIGATDSRHFVSNSEAVLRFLPFWVSSEDLATMHGKNERVRRAELRRAIAFYRGVIQDMCGE